MDIWILSITHRYGCNISAHMSAQGARKELFAYVAEEWDNGLTEQYGAIDSHSADEAIDAYFSAWREGLDPEFYEISRLPLQGFDEQSRTRKRLA